MVDCTRILFGEIFDASSRRCSSQSESTDKDKIQFSDWHKDASTMAAAWIIIHIFVHISTVSIRTVTSFREKLVAVGRRQSQSFSLAFESVWWEKEQQRYEK